MCQQRHSSACETQSQGGGRGVPSGDTLIAQSVSVGEQVALTGVTVGLSVGVGGASVGTGGGGGGEGDT
jgi:hypothetical protein